VISLPSIPSQLLRLALNDLELCEQDPRFRIKMETWLVKNEGEDYCSVCLAGAVMAKTLQTPIPFSGERFSCAPSNFGMLERQLGALDSFRVGHLGNGFDRLGRVISYNLRCKLQVAFEPKDFSTVDSFYMEYYEKNPEGFKSQMISLANIFESVGL